MKGITIIGFSLASAFMARGAQASCQAPSLINDTSLFGLFYTVNAHRVNDWGDFYTCTEAYKNTEFCAIAIPGVANLGICIPDSCSSEDFGRPETGLADYVLENVPPLALSLGKFTPLLASILGKPGVVTCGEYAIPLDDNSRAVVAFFSAWACLSVVGTVLYCVVLLPKRAKPGSLHPCGCKMRGEQLLDDVHSFSDNDVLAGTGSSSRASAPGGDFKLLPASAGTAEAGASAPGGHSAPKKHKSPYMDTAFSPLARCGLAFSLPHNMSSMLATGGDRSGKFASLNGVRAISMGLVIMGHTVAGMLSLIGNAIHVVPPKGILGKWHAQVIYSAEYAVDAFFFLSAFLLVVTVGSKLQKLVAKLDAAAVDSARSTPGQRAVAYASFFGKALLHRWLRLAPTLAFMILIGSYLAPLVSSGPIWHNMKHEFAQECVNDQQWWKNLLFINNLSPHADNLSKECLPWTWYLGNDMQFFIVGVLVMILEACVPRAGIATVLALTIASLSAGTNLVYENHLNPNAFAYSPPGVERGDDNTLYYVVPWYRWPAYAIGMCAGWMYQAVTADAVAELQRSTSVSGAAARGRSVPTSPRQRPKDGGATGNDLMYNFTELGSLQRADSGLSAALMAADSRPEGSGSAVAGGAKKAVGGGDGSHGDPFGDRAHNAKPGDALLYGCVDTCGAPCTRRFTSLCGAGMHPAVAHGIVLLCGAYMAFLFYAPVSSYEKPGWSRSFNTFYNAWGKVTFCMALGGMLHVLHLGRMPYLQRVLGWGALEPISRLTYSTYLVHFICMMVRYYSEAAPIDYTTVWLIGNFFANWVLSHLAGAAVFLFIEKPLANLEIAGLSAMCGM